MKFLAAALIIIAYFGLLGFIVYKPEISNWHLIWALLVSPNVKFGK